MKRSETRLGSTYVAKSALQGLTTGPPPNPPCRHRPAHSPSPGLWLVGWLAGLAGLAGFTVGPQVEVDGCAEWCALKCTVTVLALPLSRAVLSSLFNHARQAQSDPNVKAIVVTGAQGEWQTGWFVHVTKHAMTTV